MSSKMDACSHPMYSGVLCIKCGANLEELGLLDEESANSREVMQAGGVIVRIRDSQSQEQHNLQRLLKLGKLVLILDLDKTLLHASSYTPLLVPLVEHVYDGAPFEDVADRASRELSSIRRSSDSTDSKNQNDTHDRTQLTSPHLPNYLTQRQVHCFHLSAVRKGGELTLNQDMHVVADPSGSQQRIKTIIALRPHLHAFLDRVSRVYELGLYTMGTRPYAQKALQIIDPDGRYFRHQIVARDDFAKEQKHMGKAAAHRKVIQRLFLVPSSVVLVLDDTLAVWRGDSQLESVLRCHPFHVWDTLPIQRRGSAEFLRECPLDAGMDAREQDATATVRSRGAVQCAETSAGGGEKPSGAQHKSDAVDKSCVDAGEHVRTASEKRADGIKPPDGLEPSKEQNATDTVAGVAKTGDATAGTKPGATATAGAKSASTEAAGCGKSTGGSGGGGGLQVSGATVPPGFPKHLHPWLNTLRCYPEDNTLLSLASVLEAVHHLCYSLPHSGQDERKTEAADHHGSPLGNPIATFSFPSPQRNAQVALRLIRRSVLDGCVLCFSGVFPTDVDPKLQFWWRMAEWYGARCTTQLTRQCTHLVARRPNTVKAKQGLKWQAESRARQLTRGQKPFHVVHADWLQVSCAHFARASEIDFHFLPPPPPVSLKRPLVTTNQHSATSTSRAGADASSERKAPPQGKRAPRSLRQHCAEVWPHLHGAHTYRRQCRLVVLKNCRRAAVPGDYRDTALPSIPLGDGTAKLHYHPRFMSTLRREVRVPRPLMPEFRWHNLHPALLESLSTGHCPRPLTGRQMLTRACAHYRPDGPNANARAEGTSDNFERPADSPRTNRMSLSTNRLLRGAAGFRKRMREAASKPADHEREQELRKKALRASINSALEDW